MLRDYILELHTSNPGTTVKLQVEPPINHNESTRVFRRIYVCLGPLKRGFRSASRELIGLDGDFMSGPFPGQVLTAVSVDSNNGIYPIAYAIVEAETLDSWTWFLANLGDDLELDSRSNYTFISDRQKGIIPALAKMFPSAEHRYCLKHIHENMKQKWRGQAFKNHLWRCATATIVQEFQRYMEEFKRYSEPAYNWLVKIPPQHWARSHFSGRAKSDVLLNNMCKVLNSKTVKGKDKPIIHCLEYIREYLMIRIGNVQKVIDKCQGPLTPTAHKLLEVVKKEANPYKAIFNGEVYQVSGPWGDQTVVNVEKRTCTCRRLEITGLPCKHAVCVNWNMALNKRPVGAIETWVDPIYRLDTWKLMYKFKINPTNGVNMWNKSQIPTMIIPPKYHTPVGRPRKKRRKTEEELQMVKNGKLSRKHKSVVCKTCGKSGHNKRSCKDGQASGSQNVPTQSSQATSNVPSEGARQNVAAQVSQNVPRQNVGD
uniref:uncharacterized protein LOC122590086 n=1 Tax=Erigeron canadensis TaxID=72917 RepID=UPI001CB89C15|nr:uncharacterized protein LOC122590086 [Erigeron canadensis]